MFLNLWCFGAFGAEMPPIFTIVMGKLHTRTINNISTALLVLTAAFGLIFTVNVGTVHASTVTPTELTELYVSLAIIPAENADDAYGVITDAPDDFDLVELTELYIALDAIPAEHAYDARAIVTVPDASINTRTLTLSPESPTASVIAFDEINLTRDVLVFAFEITADEPMDVYEVPIQIETGTKNIWDVIDDTYLYVNGTQHRDYFTSGCSDTNSCVMTFDMAAGELVDDGMPMTLYHYVDLRESMGGGYDNGETIQASINQAQADEIASQTLSITYPPEELAELLINAGFVPSGNADNARTIARIQSTMRSTELVELYISLGIIPDYEVEPVQAFLVNDDFYDHGIFVGTAVGAKHTLLSEGLFAEIVSTDENVESNGLTDDSLGVFEVKFDVTAFGGDFYLASTSAAVTYQIENSNGQEVTSTTYSVLSSTANKEANGNYKISEGDTETFTLTTHVQVNTYGYYRLVLDSVEYSDTNSGTVSNISHAVEPVSDFTTNYIFINDGVDIVDIIPPSITSVIISNETISPNDDGVKDSTTVDLTFSEIVAASKVQIVSETGTAVHESTMTDTDSLTLEWSGRNDLHNTVEDGGYVINVTIIDYSSNTTNEDVATITIDNTAPVITLIGSSTITLNVGDTFSDPGATAVDDVDGDISEKIVVGGDTINTGTTSTSTIIYSVSDAAGNIASTTRLVVVVAVETNDNTTEDDEINDGATDDDATDDSANDTGTTTDDSVTNDDSTSDNTSTDSSNTTTSRSSGGGGGGGSSRDRSAPKYTSITINGGNEGTSNRLVTLALTATDKSDPITVQVSNVNEFNDDGEWLAMKETMSWILGEGNGEKNVYVRFKDGKGNISDVISAEIWLVEKEGTPSQITTPTLQTSGSVYGASTFKFVNNFGFGTRSSDVVELQKILRSEGFFTYPTNTGYYGSVTQTAVRAYQIHYGISSTGNVDSLTRTQLNSSTRGVQAEGEISLQSFVQLLLAIGIIPQEKAEVALSAIAGM